MTRTPVLKKSASLLALLLAGGALFSFGDLPAAAAEDWLNIPGPAGATIKQVTVGNANFVWALDTTGTTWTWNGTAWIKKGCCADGISAAANGSLWGTNSGNNGAVMRWQGDRWNEDQAWGMKQVSAGNAVWGVDGAGVLHKLVPASWQRKVGIVTQISAGADGTLWGTNASTGAVSRWNGSAWIAMPKAVTRVTVANAQSIWGLDAADKFYKWSGTAWTATPGWMSSVSVANDGTTWGVNSLGKIFKNTPAGWAEIAPPASAKIKQLSVGNAGFVWALDTTGTTWQWNNTTWVKKACCADGISTTADGALWGTNNSNNGAVMRWAEGRWNEDQPWGMKQVAAGGNGVWGVDGAGILHKLVPASWQKKAGTAMKISVGADGTLWGTNPPTGAVVRWSGTAWDATVPQGVSQVSVGNAQNIWAVNSVDKVYKLNGTTWAQKPGALRNIAAASDGTVWGVNAQGLIYKWVP